MAEEKRKKKEEQERKREAKKLERQNDAGYQMQSWLKGLSAEANKVRGLIEGMSTFTSDAGHR
eukprot:10723277-Alexandrium_andersonii.AAC.1